VKNGFVLKKEEMLTSMRTLLEVLFFLAAGGATRDGTFLLSGVELIRVVDLNPNAEIGPAAL
jgi:hypothetical protein